ncbi:hypothetical protein ES703_104899 [subsurface metagenome]
MSLLESLRPECIQFDSTARNKKDVLHELAVLAKKSPILKSYSEEDIFRALEDREQIGSTGFGKGIAIPHCSLERVDAFVVGILVIPGGIDFQSLDGGKIKAFLFIIGPKAKRNQHIQILSSLSKLLKTPDVIDQLIEAGDSKTIRKLFIDQFSYSEDIKKYKGKCLFHVFIQKEDYFEDILQVFSASVQGSISVMETNNAGYYLHTLPLFSAYWSERHKTFSRIIVAVVDSDLCNDVIRRINMIADTIKEEGVLITVQDLTYSSGSIEF